MSIRDKLNTFTLVDLKNLVKRHNELYHINLSQNKGAIVEALAKQYEKDTGKHLVPKHRDNILIKIEPPKPKKELHKLLSKYIDKNKTPPVNKTGFHELFTKLLKILNTHIREGIRLNDRELFKLQDFYHRLAGLLRYSKRELKEGYKSVGSDAVKLTKQDKIKIEDDIESYSNMFESISDRMPESALDKPLVEKYYNEVADLLEI